MIFTGFANNIGAFIWVKDSHVDRLIPPATVEYDLTSNDPLPRLMPGAAPAGPKDLIVEFS